MIGSKIGAYEIGDRLGVGGMGEVYRAVDTVLKRRVAIKVLPPGLAGDPDRLARFQREAEVLAALNHPGIAAIYGLERSDGMMALVMELVEGPTLAEMLAPGSGLQAPGTADARKPEARSPKPTGLPLPDALNIARQIAEALEAAHEQGIVHRDLKPANIKVRDDGTVKVLDFGLAKALASEAAGAAASVSMSPTLSIHATQAGVILGTAAYMSPEQAAGKPVDKRTDLWSFGVVFLEMLTGRRVFDGETTSHVLAAVLKDAPDFSALPDDTPASIRRLLKRCLEKDRRKRLADAADARLEIEDALTPQAAEPSSSPSIASATVTPASSAWKRYAGVAATFAAGALVAVAVAAMLTRPRSDTPPVREMTYTPLSFEPGGNTNPTWSPDGKGIAFAGRQSEDEPFQVYVRYLDASTSTALTHLRGDSQPVAWTAAGRIVFRSTSEPAGLWSISQTGGQAEPLLAVDDRTAVSATASPDGRVLGYYGPQDGKHGVWISTPPGTPPKRYTPAPFEADTSVNAPAMRFSPDGRSLLLIRNAMRGEEAWLLPYPPDANHPPRRIFGDRLKGSTGTPRFSWMPDNRRIVLSISRGSEPNRLYVADTASGDFSLLSSGTTMQVQPAVSPDGTRAAFSEATADFDVLQVDVGTGDVSPLVATTRNEEMPAWAMRAPAMAYVTDRAGAQEIWLHEPGRPDRPIVTARDFPAGPTQFFMSPLLSPDGARLIYERIEPSGGEALWLSALGGGAPVRVTDPAVEGWAAPGGWSPDGAWLVYWTYDASGMSIARVRTTGNATPEILMRGVNPDERGNAVPVWSPAADWILHNNDGWRLLSPDGKTERHLGIQALVCTLSRDAADLYCVRGEGSGATLVSRRVAGGPERIIARLTANQIPSSQFSPSLRLTWTPDGRHLTFSAARRASSLWLLEGIGAAR